ncbi:hypothetical protein [Streptomyces triticagri]|nr:hypothetical protein [Streptomyces triticagri]
MQIAAHEVHDPHQQHTLPRLRLQLACGTLGFEQMGQVGMD